MVTDRGYMTILTNKKSLIGFQMVYLHLTLAHPKGQSQCPANFECDYFVNSDR